MEDGAREREVLALAARGSVWRMRMDHSLAVPCISVTQWHVGRHQFGFYLFTIPKNQKGKHMTSDLFFSFLDGCTSSFARVLRSEDCTREAWHPNVVVISLLLVSSYL